MDDPDTGPELRSLDHRRLAAVLTAAIGRVLAGFALIAGMMLLVPDEPSASLVLPVAVAIGGIVVYVLFFRRQIRRVAAAKYPTLQAGEALILVAAMFLALFSIVYVMTSSHTPEAFSEPLDKFTAYYFALTVLATVGFGDITPVTTFARAVTMAQMALDLVFIGVVLKVLGGTAKRALARRQEESRHDSASD